jgi:biotin carboxylase
VSSTLLVLGLSPFHGGVVEQLLEAGHRVIVAGLKTPPLPANTTWEAVDVTKREAVLQIARRHRIDGIMPVTDFAMPVCAWISKRLGLAGISEEAALAALDKGRMRDVWQAAGLPNPDYHVVRTRDEARAAAARIGFPVVLKPTASGGGGRGVAVVSDNKELDGAFAAAAPFARNRHWIVESFVAGMELTVETVSVAGRVHVLAMSDKVKPDGCAHVSTSLNYPAAVSGAVQAEVAELVSRAVGALGIHTGPAHTEVLIGAQGPVLVEATARPGGGHIFSMIVTVVTGANLVQGCAEVYLGGEPDLTPRRNCGCVYRFFHAPPGVVRKIHGIEEARSLPGVLDMGLNVQVGGSVRPLTNSLERLGFAVVAGADRDQAVRRADEVTRMVRFEIHGLDSGPEAKTPPELSNA